MAWLSIAKKRPINAASGNFSKGGMDAQLQGLVLHIQAGREDGTFNWFNTSKENREKQLVAAWEKKGSVGKRPTGGKSSAHFGNPKKGQMEQFIDTDDVAYAQMAGNKAWWSVENEGMGGDSLTPSQLDNLSQLMAILHFHEGVPLKLANDPTQSGLGYHGMGGTAWGGHTNCPGSKIVAERSLILRSAEQILLGNKHRLFFDPTGGWEVHVQKWIWNYTFEANGKLSWIDPLNGLTGAGKWMVNGTNLSLIWNDKTIKESWPLPLDFSNQSGTWTYKGKAHPVQAKRL